MTEQIDIYDRRYEGGLPPPWYRPPPHVTEGPSRAASSIIGGLLIDNDEGRRWFKAHFDKELASDHCQDLSIAVALDRLIKELNINAFACSCAPRRLESAVFDFIIVTYIENGHFIHNGPETYDEVCDDRKPIPGRAEEELKEELSVKLRVYHV
ncbi:hypothetical protein H0H87_001609 [Tephrocybe sp. NHM501043]|nr:hypothetical protein H0H87_001609 [Tephrocybe sp. NHM501043]